MDPITGLEAALLKLCDVAGDVAEKGHSATQFLRDVPRTREDIEDALIAWHDAKLANEAHMRNYPGGKEQYENDDDCREDWHRVMRLTDEAERRLRHVAQAIRTARTRAA